MSVRLPNATAASMFITLLSGSRADATCLRRLHSTTRRTAARASEQETTILVQMEVLQVPASHFLRAPTRRPLGFLSHGLLPKKMRHLTGQSRKRVRLCTCSSSVEVLKDSRLASTTITGMATAKLISPARKVSRELPSAGKAVHTKVPPRATWAGPQLARSPQVPVKPTVGHGISGLGSHPSWVRMSEQQMVPLFL